MDDNNINDNSTIPTYKINYFPFNSTWNGKEWETNKVYLDWDSNSGMLCGNTWGKPSEQARIIYNILSLWSDDSMLFDMDKGNRNDFLGNIFYYPTGNSSYPYRQCTSSDWQSGYWSNGVECFPNVWGKGLKYVHGFMGTLGEWLKWGEQYCLKNNEGIYWYHAGATYGYGSYSLFIPASISGDFTGSLLEGNDIAFVCSNNYDYDDVNTSYAVSYVCWKITNSPTDYKDKNSLHSLLYEALYNVFTPDLKISNVGMTPTLGYYYIDKQGNSVSDWATITLDYDNNGKLIQTTTNSLYPFKNEYLGTTIEPAYYFGSGTKPITAIMVVNALYRATKSQWKNTGDFRNWYIGPYFTQTYGRSLNAATMKDILPLASSTYYETIGQSQNNAVTDTIQNLLQNYLYSSNACDYKGYTQFASCPSRISDSSKQPTNCKTIGVDNFNNIFMNNVSVFDIACMRAGIPDSDTLGLDTPDQKRERTHSFGPLEYVSELIGFDWWPGYTYDTSTKNWNPITPGAYNPYYPPLSYSSSGFTLLGSFLWFLDYNVGKKLWWEIDINSSFLPPNLETLTNFAGTSGNNGTKYMIGKGETF